ncbi:MAG: uroporphyrinogen decarboxylase [Flavobacteriales bacterium]
MLLENDLLLRAANGELTERSPVWLMRQAGRILPEYREVRKSVKDFRELVETPEKVAEVTVQPVDLLGVDAAIIFSDILVVADVLGFAYGMETGKGPVFEKTLWDHWEDLRDPEDIHVEKELAYVAEGIRKSKERLAGRVPLIGFAGAPWTLFTYLAEGEGSKSLSKARKLLYQAPQRSEEIIQRITDVTLSYLRMQIQAGADIVQIFDSWASVLGPVEYRKFGLEPIRRICEGIKDVPTIVFAKGASHMMESLKELPCEVIGMDWTMDVEKTKNVVGGNKTLQGNLDPALLYSDPAQIRERTERMLEAFSGHPHIANLGHGVLPDTDPDHVREFINAVKNHASYVPH